MKLSVIIPVYNESSTIGEVLRRVAAVNLEGIEKEVIVCDDGSDDGTAEVIERNRVAQSDLIKVHTSPVNLGKGAAIRSGLKSVNGDIVLIQDADLELDPDNYHDLLQPFIDESVTVVYGSRFKSSDNEGISLRTRSANRFLTALTNFLFGSQLTDMETGYKVFRTEVIKQIPLRSLRFEIEPEITAKLLKAGHRIHEVAIRYKPRTKQEGKKMKFRDGLAAIWTLLRCRF